MAKEKRTYERKSGGMYRGVSVPIKVLDWVIVIGGVVLVGVFVFALFG